MSVAVRGRVFTLFWGNQFKKLSSRTRGLKFSSAANNKSLNLENVNVPASETDKISAAVLKKFSDSLVIENIDPPKMLRDDEVLIDVRYCALNSSDVLLAKNLHKFEPALPIILGYELVGKVIKVEEQAKRQGYKIGDKVVALNKDCYGGLADQCIAKVNDIWKVPSEVKSLDAVGLFDNYITALVALERVVCLEEGDMMFVNVGVSGIGLAAVDLATNVFKAQVVSICATENIAELAREKGVLASLKYENDDRKLFKKIEKLTDNEGIKAIFDNAKGESFRKILSCFTDVYKGKTPIKDLLRDDSFAVVVHWPSDEGRVIIAGTTAPRIDNDSESDSEVEKESFSITEFNLQEYKRNDPKSYREAGNDVLQFLEEGLIKPTYMLPFGLSKVNDALELIFNCKSSGKIIIDIKDR